MQSKFHLDVTTDNGNTVTADKLITHEDWENLVFTVAANQTKKGYEFKSLEASRKGLLITTTQNVTIGLNDAGTPEQSKDLTSTNPGVWWDGMPGDAFWTDDIDGIYFTTGAGGAVVTIRILKNNVAL